jgi:hypothetical protein
MIVYGLQPAKLHNFLAKTVVSSVKSSEKCSYAKRLVCRMPRKGDCGSAETAVPLHRDSFTTRNKQKQNILLIKGKRRFSV